MKKTELVFMIFVVIGIIGSYFSEGLMFGKIKSWLMVAAALGTAIILTRLINFLFFLFHKQKLLCGVEKNKKKKKRKNKKMLESICA